MADTLLSVKEKVNDRAELDQALVKDAISVEARVEMAREAQRENKARDDGPTTHSTLAQENERIENIDTFGQKILRDAATAQAMMHAPGDGAARAVGAARDPRSAHEQLNGAILSLQEKSKKNKRGLSAELESRFAALITILPPKEIEDIAKLLQKSDKSSVSTLASLQKDLAIKLGSDPDIKSLFLAQGKREELTQYITSVSEEIVDHEKAAYFATQVVKSAVDHSEAKAQEIHAEFLKAFPHTTQALQERNGSEALAGLFALAHDLGDERGSALGSGSHRSGNEKLRLERLAAFQNELALYGAAFPGAEQAVALSLTQAQDSAHASALATKYAKLIEESVLKHGHRGGEQAARALNDFEAEQKGFLDGHPALRAAFTNFNDQLRAECESKRRNAEDSVASLRYAVSHYKDGENDPAAMERAFLEALSNRSSKEMLLIRKIYEEQSGGRLLADDINLFDGKVKAEARKQYLTKAVEPESPSKTSLDKTIAAYFSSEKEDAKKAFTILTEQGTSRQADQVALQLRGALNSAGPMAAAAHSLLTVTPEQGNEGLRRYATLYGSDFEKDLNARGAATTKRASEEIAEEMVRTIHSSPPVTDALLARFFDAKVTETATERGRLVALAGGSNASIAELDASFNAFVRDWSPEIKLLGVGPQLSQAFSSIELTSCATTAADRIRERERQVAVESLFDQKKAVTFRKQADHYVAALASLSPEMAEYLGKIQAAAGSEARQFIERVQEREREFGVATRAFGSSAERACASLENMQGEERAVLDRLSLQNTTYTIQQRAETTFSGIEYDRVIARLNADRSGALAADAADSLSGMFSARSPEKLTAILRSVKSEKDRREFDECFAKNYAHLFPGTKNSTATSFAEAAEKRVDSEHRGEILALAQGNTALADARELAKLITVPADEEEFEGLRQNEAVTVAKFFEAMKTADDHLDKARIKAVLKAFDVEHPERGTKFIAQVSKYDGVSGAWVRALAVGNDTEARVHKLEYALHADERSVDQKLLSEVFALPKGLEAAANRFDQLSAQNQATVYARIAEFRDQRATVLSEYQKRYHGDAVSILSESLDREQFRAALALINEGQIAPEDKLFFALHRHGVGNMFTDEDTIREVIIGSGLDRKELTALADRYYDKHKGRKLRDELASNLSGDDNFDVLDRFDNGIPKNVDDKFKALLRRKEYERSGLIGKVVDQRGKDSIGKEIDEAQKLYSKVKAGTASKPEQDRFNALISQAEGGLEAWRLGRHYVGEIATELATGAVVFTVSASTLGTGTPLAASAGCVVLSALGTRAVMHSAIDGYGYDGYGVAHDSIKSIGDGGGILLGGYVGKALTLRAYEKAGEMALKSQQFVGPGGMEFVAEKGTKLTKETVQAVGEGVLNNNTARRVLFHAEVGTVTAAASMPVQAMAYTISDDHTFDGTVGDAVKTVGAAGLHAVETGALIGAPVGAVLGVRAPISARNAQVATINQTDEALLGGRVGKNRIGTEEIKVLNKLQEQKGMLHVGDLKSALPLENENALSVIADAKASEETRARLQALYERKGYLSGFDVAPEGNWYVTRKDSLQDLESLADQRRSDLRTLDGIERKERRYIDGEALTLESKQDLVKDRSYFEEDLFRLQERRLNVLQRNADAGLNPENGIPWTEYQISTLDKDITRTQQDLETLAPAGARRAERLSIQKQTEALQPNNSAPVDSYLSEEPFKDLYDELGKGTSPEGGDSISIKNEPAPPAEVNRLTKRTNSTEPSASTEAPKPVNRLSKQAPSTESGRLTQNKNPFERVPNAEDKEALLKAASKKQVAEEIKSAPKVNLGTVGNRYKGGEPGDGGGGADLSPSRPGPDAPTSGRALRIPTKLEAFDRAPTPAEVESISKKSLVTPKEKVSVNKPPSSNGASAGAPSNKLAEDSSVTTLELPETKPRFSIEPASSPKSNRLADSPHSEASSDLPRPPLKNEGTTKVETGANGDSVAISRKNLEAAISSRSGDAASNAVNNRHSTVPRSEERVSAAGVKTKGIDRSLSRSDLEQELRGAAPIDQGATLANNDSTVISRRELDAALPKKAQMSAGASNNPLKTEPRGVKESDEVIRALEQQLKSDKLSPLYRQSLEEELTEARAQFHAKDPAESARMAEPTPTTKVSPATSDAHASEFNVDPIIEETSPLASNSHQAALANNPRLKDMRASIDSLEQGLRDPKLSERARNALSDELSERRQTLQTMEQQELDRIADENAARINYNPDQDGPGWSGEDFGSDFDGGGGSSGGWGGGFGGGKPLGSGGGGVAIAEPAAAVEIETKVVAVETTETAQGPKAVLAQPKPAPVPKVARGKVIIRPDIGRVPQYSKEPAGQIAKRDLTAAAKSALKPVVAPQSEAPRFGVAAAGEASTAQQTVLPKPLKKPAPAIPERRAAPEIRPIEEPSTPKIKPVSVPQPKVPEVVPLRESTRTTLKPSAPEIAPQWVVPKEVPTRKVIEVERPASPQITPETPSRRVAPAPQERPGTKTIPSVPPERPSLIPERRGGSEVVEPSRHGGARVAERPQVTARPVTVEEIISEPSEALRPAAVPSDHTFSIPNPFTNPAFGLEGLPELGKVATNYKLGVEGRKPKIRRGRYPGDGYASGQLPIGEIPDGVGWKPEDIEIEKLAFDKPHEHHGVKEEVVKRQAMVGEDEKQGHDWEFKILKGF